MISWERFAIRSEDLLGIVPLNDQVLSVFYITQPSECSFTYLTDLLKLTEDLAANFRLYCYVFSRQKYVSKYKSHTSSNTFTHEERRKKNSILFLHFLSFIPVPARTTTDYSTYVRRPIGLYTFICWRWCRLQGFHSLRLFAMSPFRPWPRIHIFVCFAWIKEWRQKERNCDRER